jgi:hypothetical protein
MMKFRRRKTYLEGIMEGRYRERRDAVHLIRAYADSEEHRLKAAAADEVVTGTGHALRENWLGGIRDAALVVEGSHPYFPSKPEKSHECVCTCGKVHPCDQDPHRWKPQAAVGGANGE